MLKNKISKIFIILIVLFAGLLITACGKNSDDSSKDEKDPVYICAIELNENGDLICKYSNDTEKNIGNVNGAVTSNNKLVIKAELNNSGRLELTLNDGSVIEVGTGVNTNSNGIKDININSNGELVVTFVDGTEKKINLKDETEDTGKEYSKEEYFDLIAESITNSPATKISTTINYYLPSYDVSLFFSSTLVIVYSNTVSTKYSYSYQKINDISSGYEEMISTYSGTFYTKGSTVGEATENGIKWIDVIEGSVTLFSFNFDKSLFLDGWTATEKGFDGKIQPGKENTFFVKNYGVSDVSVKVMKNNDNRISRIMITYKNEKGAVVTVNTNYSYELETIEYE